VLRREDWLIDRHVHGQHAPRDDAGEIRGLEMVGCDPGQHLCIQPAGIRFGELAELRAIGRLVVPPREIAMNLREVVALLQLRGQRAFAGCRFADTDKVGPAALSFESRRLRRQVFGRITGGAGHGRRPAEGGLIGSQVANRAQYPDADRQQAEQASPQHQAGRGRRGADDVHEGNPFA